MIAALILAAGASSRMGRPKLALPWGETTVLGNVVHTIKAAGIEDILVVIGGGGQTVEAICSAEGLRAVLSQEPAGGDMLSSLQTGLREMRPAAGAALVALGDQPQIEETTVRQVARPYLDSTAPIVVPSYRMRRGHPWLVSRLFWKEILGMGPPETPRHFLDRHALDIHYVDVHSPAILEDLDSPEDYLLSRP
jgi:molybdenum cofactor cytidylyltransferase